MNNSVVWKERNIQKKILPVVINICQLLYSSQFQYPRQNVVSQDVGIWFFSKLLQCGKFIWCDEKGCKFMFILISRKFLILASFVWILDLKNMVQSPMSRLFYSRYSIQSLVFMQQSSPSLFMVSRFVYINTPFSKSRSYLHIRTDCPYLKHRISVYRRRVATWSSCMQWDHSSLA